MSDFDDGKCIKAYLDGDQSAFEELYNQYRKPLYSYLNRLVAGQGALADDIYQQVWIKAVDRLARFKPSGSFLSWLLRIAHNLFIDHCRRVKRHEIQPDDLKKRSYTPFDDLDSTELGKVILKAMDQLEPLQREVFVLRQDGIPFKEIAEIQNASINTVLARMRYATDNLKKILRDCI